MSHDKHLRSTRLPELIRQELLDRLDRHASSEEALRRDRANKRKDPRWPYRQNDIEVTVEHPAGGVSRLLLASRNLSAGGIAFIHGGFVYPRSRCKMSLIRLDGQNQLLTGTIVNCRHVQGLLHEIGLKFDRRIDPHQFVRLAVTHTVAPTDRVELSDLHGRILLVDSSEADRALLAYHLRGSGIKLIPVGTPGAALDTVKQHIIDIIMTELHVDGHDGVDLISRIRATKFRGPIVAITAEVDQKRIVQAREAGAGHVLTKPYDPEDLQRLLIQLHRKIGAVLTQSVLYSTIDDQPEMEPLIAQYIEQTRRAANASKRTTSPRRGSCASCSRARRWGMDSRNWAGRRPKSFRPSTKPSRSVSPPRNCAPSACCAIACGCVASALRSRPRDRCSIGLCQIAEQPFHAALSSADAGRAADAQWAGHSVAHGDVDEQPRQVAGRFVLAHHAGALQR